MRVFMTDFFLPDNTYVYEMGKELKKYVSLTIACKRGSAIHCPGITWDDFIYEGGKSRAVAAALYAGQLYLTGQELRTGHYDVVHPQFFRDIAKEMPVYIHNKKHYGILAHTIHKLVPPEKQEERELYREFYEACDLIITHNVTSKNELIEGFGVPEYKIAVVPMGGYPVPGQRVRPFHVDGKVRFLMFGQFRHYKGIDTVLKAAALIPEEKRKKMEIMIAGKQYKKLDPSDYGKMATDFGVQKFVKIREGFVADAMVPHLFASADIGLVPYRELQGSASLILMYGYGKPVIVSDLPLLMEETGDGATGISFKTDDPSSLAKAMLSVLDWTEDDMAGYRNGIRDLMESKYNWEVSARLLYDAYSQALRRKNR